MSSGRDREREADGKPVVVVDPNAVQPNGGASAATPCQRIREDGAGRGAHGPATRFSSGTDVVDLSELERVE